MSIISVRTARPIYTAVFAAAILFAPGLRANAAPPKPAPKAAPAPHAAPAVHGPSGGASHAGGAAGGHTTTTTTSRTTTTGVHGATTTTSRTTTTTGGRPGMAGGRPTTAGGFGGGRPGAAGGRPGGFAGGHGSMAHAGPAGSHDRVGSHGEMVRTRANGRPMDVHTRGGMDIHHNLGGGRRVDYARPGGGRMVYERGRPGYISHPYGFRGHDYYRRSYYYNGRSYNRFYNHYGYRGVYLDVYSPARFYGVGFYGWAYNPWVRPVPYAWGWGGAPWLGFYGAYFTPYPVYAAPAFWLTDYLISQSLQASYEARQANAADAAAAQGGAPPAPMSAEDKQMIVNEVKAQIALENAEAQANSQGQVADASGSSIARMLSDGQPHVFIPGKEVDLVDTNGQECAVTDGDVLQLSTPPPAEATAATLTVIASKGGVECRKGAQVSVAFDDLQEMHNHMRETLDTGLQELQAKQGQGGLPPAPASATGAPVTAAVAENAPPPDPAGAQELAQQAQEADKSEQEALGSTAGAAGSADVAAAAPAPVATATISLGQSTDDVKAALGQPVRIINLGAKTIYQYKDMKITFKAGKVSDVE